MYLELAGVRGVTVLEKFAGLLFGDGLIRGSYKLGSVMNSVRTIFWKLVLDN